MFHCSYIVLQRLLDGNLPKWRSALCRFHLKRCPACAELLKKIRIENSDICQFSEAYAENIRQKAQITQIINSSTK